MFTKHLNHEPKRRVAEPTDEELAKMREARKVEQENNMYYLKPSTKPVPEIKTIELNIPLKISSLVNSDQYMDNKKKEKKAKKKKKKKKNASSSEDEPPVNMEVNTNIGEMPEGAELSDNEQDNGLSETDPHRALDIDLDMPLREEERLPVRAHRALPDPVEPKKKKDKKVKKKKEKEVVADLWLDTGKSEYESVPEKTKKKKKKEEKKPKRSKRKEEDKQGGLLVDEPEPQTNGQEQVLVAVEPTATVLAKNNNLSLVSFLEDSKFELKVETGLSFRFD